MNCNAALTGRYCHVCGQENLEPKETVWHLVQHFFNDITHFDGKFFSTVGLLMRKPGFLSKEYMAGRRASYLNPIRMYVFTSAIFFLIFFSLKRPDEFMKINDTPDKELSLPELKKLKLDDERKMKTAEDEDDRLDYAEAVRKLDLELATIKSVYGDTTTKTFSKADRKLLLLRGVTDSAVRASFSSSLRDSLNVLVRLGKIPDTAIHTSIFGWDVSQYKSVEAYDSLQKRMPDSLKDGWFKRIVMRRSIVAGEELHRDRKAYFAHFAEHMLHSFPKILFWSLPFFALILNVLYYRHKQYYYVDHGIFTIHVYCATFIFTLGMVLLNQLDSLGMEWLKVVTGVLNFALFIWIMIYLYKAMRGFYGQRRGKTILKYLIACSLALAVNMLLLIIFVLISAMSV